MRFSLRQAIAIGVLFMSILAASGLGAVIHESPVMFYGLQLCGCLLLFWFGWKSWTAPAISLSSSIKSFNPKELKQERIHILTSAALLQVTNPDVYRVPALLIPTVYRSKKVRTSNRSL